MTGASFGQATENIVPALQFQFNAGSTSNAATSPTPTEVGPVADTSLVSTFSAVRHESSLGIPPGSAFRFDFANPTRAGLNAMNQALVVSASGTTALTTVEPLSSVPWADSLAAILPPASPDSVPGEGDGLAVAYGSSLGDTPGISDPLGPEVIAQLFTEPAFKV